MTDFKKYDNGKPQMAYLQWKQLEEVARVQDKGAIKYGRENWHKSPSRMRYISAAMRHIGAFCCGEKKDPETGKPPCTRYLLPVIRYVAL